MDDSVLLFQGIGNSTCGSCAAGRKRMAKRNYGRVPVKRRRRSRGVRGIGSVGNMRGLGASASVKETLGAVKGIVYQGAIAGAGAFVTGKVWDMIAASIIGTEADGKTLKTIEANTLALAKMATGIAIGLVISKLLKKQVIGVAFATGAVAVGMKDLLFRALASTEEKAAEKARISLELMGIPQIRQSGEFQRAIAASSFQGVPAIGPGIPSWMDVPQETNFTYAN